MKTIITLIFVFFIGFAAKAQATTKEVKVETIATSIVTTIELEETANQNIQVARLYKFKNSRVKKELAFRTKRNRSKLA